MAAEAGVYICLSCRDNASEDCNDYCAMEQVRELPALWLEGFPPCECCGRVMHLLRPLVALAT